MFEMDESDFEEMEHQERLRHDDKVKEIMEEKKMTDEEKAEELTAKQFDLDTDKVRYFCNLYKNDYHEVHTFYNGVLKGLEEGRKETFSEAVIENLKEKHESNKRALKLIIKKGVELEKENAELKAEIEKMKLCENCRHWVEPFESKCICIDCHKMNKWEVNNV